MLNPIQSMTIDKMSNLKFGDIVLLKFPYTDETSFKRRPALVLSDTDDGDIIVLSNYQPNIQDNFRCAN